MSDHKKSRRKLFNIFEKDKTCSSLNEILHSDVKTPKFNLKLTAKRRSTRSKSEVFVERVPPDSPEKDPYAFTNNDFEDTKLVYTPPKKKAKISKSPSFMERIDRYFNIQPSKASNTSANSCRTILDATEEAELKIDKARHSKASNSPKLKEDDLQEYADSFIDSIDTNAIVDMLINTERVESQSQVKNENSTNFATPKKYNRKSNEKLNSKFSSKENNNLQKRKSKSNTSKIHQNVVESPVDCIHTNAIIDSIDTNAIVDMLINTEIVESQSQVMNENSKNFATPKKYNRKSNDKLNAIVCLNSKERKVTSKENNHLQKIEAKSNISKKNQNVIDSSEIVEEKSQVQNGISKCNTTPKKYHTSKGRVTKPKEILKTIVSLETTERKVSCKENKDLQATKTRSKSKKNNKTDEDYSHTLQLLRPKGRKVKFNACQLANDDYVVSKNNDALNITNTFNTQKNLQKSLITETSASLSLNAEKSVENKISVSLSKRERRQTISSIQMDNNITEAYNSQQLSVSLSPQKAIENEKSVSLRKRSRRPTISGIKMDNNVAEVAKSNDSCQFPPTALASSSQKSVENEISVPIRKRGRRQTICGIQMDNNDAEITETNESSQFAAASRISSSQKSVENEKSVSLRKRGRQPTISGIQMDNNAAEVPKPNDSCQYPTATLTLSPQKSVENGRSVSLKKRGRRPTISDIKMDKNGAEVTETNDSSQFPATSLIVSPQKSLENDKSVNSQNTVKNEITVPIRKRGRRQTICDILMDNNVAEITETNESSQFPAASLISSPQKSVENEKSLSLRKRGRRPIISGIQMDNNVAEVAIPNDSCQLPPAALTSSPQKSVENGRSVSLKKRGRRPTISYIKMDKNGAEVTETNESSQFPATSLISSPQNSLENEKSVSLRKRVRRPTISGIQMDKNGAEVTETNDSSQFPATSLISSPRKTLENDKSLSSQNTVKNEISAPIRKRGRRQTICGIQMDNNVAEITETNDSSQLHTTSLTLSPQKSVERLVSLRKRGRRPTISGIQMDNNVAEITETNDSSQLHTASLTLSPQKTVKNEISVPIRKRGRRQTICGIQTEKNIAKVTETNDSSQMPSALMTSCPQKTIENEKSVSLRKRGRRLTISGTQMDNNIADVTETNGSSQFPSKRGRRPTICQTKLENYFIREAKKTDESSLENQTEKSSDENVTKTITKTLNETCISKLNDNINSMVNNNSDEQNTHRLPVNHKEKLTTESQQIKNQSIESQKIRSTDPKDNKVVEEPKRKRGRPRLSPNEKQVKMRIKKINIAKKPKNTYGRLSKDKLNSANIRKIPKDRLDEVLDMLQNEDHEIWKDRNISCNAGIHRYWEPRTMTSDQNMKMKYARQFLLRRDWLNLSKILCLSNQDTKNNIYYPLLVKVINVTFYWLKNFYC